MTQSEEAWGQAEGAGLPASADVPFLARLRLKDPRTQVALGVAAVLVVGLAVVGFSRTNHGPAAQTTDYVSGFEGTCLPGATKNYLAAGTENAQATAQASAFCHCVATTVSDKVSPDVFAEVSRTKKMPNSMVLAIGSAAKSCQQ